MSRAYGSEAAIWVQGSYFTLATLASFICTKLGTLFSIISGAIKAFIAALAVPWVGWTIAALVLIGIVITIVLNWSRICSCFEHIKAWFTAVDKNKHTASINNTFNQMSSKAVAQAKEDAYTRTRAQTNLGKWTKTKLESYLSRSLHIGYSAVSVDELSKKTDNEYVYLGKFLDSGNDYRSIARRYNGIYYEMPNYLINEVANYLNNNFWVLNLYFLNLCIANGKIFRLCTSTNDYYVQGYPGYLVENNPCAYARELQYIHENQYRSYSWYYYIAAPFIETY